MASTTDPAASRHNMATRLVHALMALAVISQLLSSLVMKPPHNGNAGNFFFEIHEYGGLSAFVMVLLFWIVLTARTRGTPASLLFPWFSGARLSALWSDIKQHAQALRHLTLPPYDGDSPLASAVHGLGILLVTTMATTGTLNYFLGGSGGAAGQIVKIAMWIHHTLGGVVWAYLIGHVSLAVLQHFITDFDLRKMWDLRKAPKVEPPK